MQVAQLESALGKSLASLERAVGVQLNEHPIAPETAPAPAPPAPDEPGPFRPTPVPEAANEPGTVPIGDRNFGRFRLLSGSPSAAGTGSRAPARNVGSSETTHPSRIAPDN